MARSRYSSPVAYLSAISLLLLLWSGLGAAPSVADVVVDEDGQAEKLQGGDVDCSGTEQVYDRVDRAVSDAESGGVVYICTGTYGPDENITIEKNIELKTVGGAVTIESTASSDQGPAILVQEPGPEITTVEVKGGTDAITIQHTSTSANTSVETIRVNDGVEGVELKNLVIDRGDNLASTSAGIRPNNIGLTVSDTEIRGGPIGTFGGPNGDYTITNTTIEGAGDEGIWIVDANTLTLKNNTIKTTNDGSAPNDRLGIAVYNVETRLELGNNTIQATKAPLVLGDDIPVRAAGQSFTLTTVDDMQRVLRANTINGGSPGKATFLAQTGGALLGESDGKGNNGQVHVVRTGLTNISQNGGAVPYSQSAIEGAQAGDVIQLTGGATYSETVTLTSSPSSPAEADKNLSFAAPTTVTLETLQLQGAYTVGVPSGPLTIGAALTLGDGSTLTGSPIALGNGATLTDNGLASGSIKAVRTVGDGATVDFGNIGLTLTEDGGTNSPGTVTVTRTDGDPVTLGDGSIDRYYDVSAASNSGLNVDLTFAYDEAELNGYQEGSLALFRSDDGGTNWDRLSTDAQTPSSNTLTQQDLSGFSRFTAAGASSTLPVELTQLEAVTESDAVVLRWSTASETNNAGFRVQHKTDQGYDTVDFVEGEGTTRQSTTYRFRVDDLDYGAHTFRLQQVDQDGTTHLSDPVSVTFGLEGQYEVSKVAPNPVAARSQVEMAVQQSQDVTVALYDALGRRVTTLHTGTMAPKTTHRLGIDSRGLSSGTYFLRVKGDHFQTTRQVVVVR